MNFKLAVVCGLAISLALGVALSAPAKEAKPAPQSVNKELSAQKIRFGQEAYGRGQYRVARDFFRQAVMADPASKKAWSWYDLASLYDIAQSYRYAVEKSGRMALPKIEPAAPTAPASPAAPAAKAAPAAPAAPAAKPAKPAAPAKPGGDLPAIPQDEGC